MLIDASGFAHRAYHVGANQFRSSDGLPTWAVTGFLSMMWSLLGRAQADQPTHAVALFDAPGKNFRHKLFPAYKNNRPARDLELTAQLPWMHHAAEAMGIKPFELTGYEADDLIATLAAKAMKAKMRVTIVSSDKDLTQCCVEDWVEVIEPVKRERICAADVVKGPLGVSPKQVPDFQALAGDSVDNIPGIEGVGSKSAARFIRLFENVEGVVAATKSRPGYFPPLQRMRIRGALKELRLYRTLATLRTDVPVKLKFSDLVLKPVMREHVEAILDKLEARGRFDAIFGTEPKVDRVVEACADPLEWWREELLAPGQRVPDEPQCGFYQRRLLKGGTLVPARIWRDAELDPFSLEPTGREILKCQVGPDRRDAVSEWSRLCMGPISEEKYRFEMADGAWAKKYAPTDPKAYPDKPVDLTKVPIPVFATSRKKRGKDEQRSRTGSGP